MKQETVTHAQNKPGNRNCRYGEQDVGFSRKRLKAAIINMFKNKGKHV